MLLAVVSECGFDNGIRLGSGFDLIHLHRSFASNTSEHALGMLLKSERDRMAQVPF
jgi:hypothetical protein